MGPSPLYRGCWAVGDGIEGCTSDACELPEGVAALLSKESTTFGVELKLRGEQDFLLTALVI